jgi:hypothetical protein
LESVLMQCRINSSVIGVSLICICCVR